VVIANKERFAKMRPKCRKSEEKKIIKGQLPLITSAMGKTTRTISQKNSPRRHDGDLSRARPIQDEAAKDHRGRYGTIAAKPKA